MTVCALIWQDKQACGTDTSARVHKHDDSSRGRYSTAVDAVTFLRYVRFQFIQKKLSFSRSWEILP